MIKTILLCAVFVLFVLNLSALDITTTDGKVYKNVKVTNVLPDAVGFMYTKKDGTMVLRDVKIALLTKNLQEKFNYSPEKAEIFRKQVAVFQAKRNKLLQKHHQEDLKLFREQKKNAKELDHIKAVLYAHRLDCYVHITRSVGADDCIGMMTTTKSAPSASGYGHLGSIYVRNLSGPQNIRVAATLYPTGKTISFEDGTFPVYDTNLNQCALDVFNAREYSTSKNTPAIPAQENKTMVFPANAPQKKKMNN